MSRTARLSAVVLLVLTGCGTTRTAPPASSGGPHPSFYGTWTGTADQYDSGVEQGVPDSRWDVEATIGPQSRINYPTLNCSGTLTYLGDAPGSISFRETITSGTERCVSTGTIRFTHEGSGLVYHASHESQPSVGIARLTRR